MNYETELEDSIHYLSTDKAFNSLEADPYWPKWNSPWWHMLLLYEMGEVKRIPEATIQKFVKKMNQYPIKIFPIQPGEMPEYVDPYRGTPCHCQLGTVYQILSAWGVEADRELPWIRPWFLRYQMPDGGLNCDNDAYLVKDEVPSSMVGTISVFEAILLHTQRPWTSEEKLFLNNAARFLIGRKLKDGSSTKHNAAERDSAKKWTDLCFPRFYFYDILRGLSAILLWSEKCEQPIPSDAIKTVVESLSSRFPDGQIRIGRRSFEGVGTFAQSPDGEWLKRQPATLFPLLERVSIIGESSPFLSKQWAEVKSLLQWKRFIV